MLVLSLHDLVIRVVSDVPSSVALCRSDSGDDDFSRYRSNNHLLHINLSSCETERLIPHSFHDEYEGPLDYESCSIIISFHLISSHLISSEK